MEKYKDIIFRIVAVCLVVAISFAVGYYSRVPQTVVVTKTQVVEKIVEKIVAVSDHSTIDKTVTKADGTVERTIQINDISAISSDITVDRTVNSMTKETVAAAVRPQYSLGVHAISSIDWPVEKPHYDITIGRRVLGNVWGEAVVNTKKNVGLGLRLEF